jgi:hypothetical protein
MAKNIAHAIIVGKNGDKVKSEESGDLRLTIDAVVGGRKRSDKQVRYAVCEMSNG